MAKSNIFSKIMKPITGIVTFIKCTISMVTNFPQCCLYYLMDIIGFLLYMPFALFFWALGMKSSEKELWVGIYAIDNTIYSCLLGFHLFKYSNKTMNKCYRCTPKKERPNCKDALLKASRAGGRSLTFMEIVVYVYVLFLLWCMATYLGKIGYYVSIVFALMIAIINLVSLFKK